MPNIGILLGKQPAAKPLPFKDIFRVAELLAERLKILSEKVPYPHALHFDTKRAIEIHAALKAIAATPNGSVSRETLDEWIAELNAVLDKLKEWCEELVTFRKADLDNLGEFEDAYIPF